LHTTASGPVRLRQDESNVMSRVEELRQRAFGERRSSRKD